MSISKIVREILDGYLLNLSFNKTEHFTAHDDAILYQFKDYKGNEIFLSEGNYTFGNLENLPGSYTPYDIESIKLKPNIKLILYEDDNFQGPSRTITADKTFINVIARSLRVINTAQMYNTSQNNSNIAGKVEELEDNIKEMTNEKYELLKKYREYIDIDNLKFDVHIKNDSIIADLNNKTKEQKKNIKKLSEENFKKSKVNKDVMKQVRELEEKSNNYKKYIYFICFIILILGILLFLKYKKFNISNALSTKESSSVTSSSGSSKPITTDTSTNNTPTTPTLTIKTPK